MLSFSVVEEAWRKRWCPSADRHPETLKIGHWWTDVVRASRPPSRERPAPARGQSLS